MILAIMSAAFNLKMLQAEVILYSPWTCVS